MTRSRGLVALAALAGALVTARLGLWQLDRADQKIRLQASIEARAQQPSLQPSQLALDPIEAMAQHHRHIRLRGDWLAAHTVYLDNRQMNGRPGFFVLTPLRLASGDAVMVQRGWIPRDAADRARLQAVPTATGAVEVEGRVGPEPSKLFELGTAQGGPIRQNLDLGAFAREIGVPLRPLSVLQLDGPNASADGLLRQWPAVATDVGKHHGYAAQWFALCALIVGLYAWFQILRPRHVRHE